MLRNKMKILVFSLLLLQMMILPAALLAEITLKATVDRNQVGLNDRFVYTIEVSGETTRLPKPKFPSFESFSVLSGPNTSTNIQFINGAMSSSNTYTFYLMPTKEGVFTISPATLEVDGKVISSNSIEIKIVKPSSKPQKKADQVVKESKDQDLLGENLYLKTVIDKGSVYQNQQVTAEYKLYFRVSVRSYNVDRIPSNEGFWTEEFQLPAQPPIGTEIVNGITYQVATLRKVALFPTQTGELIIDPMVISVDALVKKQRRSRSIFDDFFNDPFGRTIKKTLSSQAVKINVKSLPSVNQPNDFNGAVGKYQLNVEPDKTELKANEAVSLVLTVSGRGNIKLLNPPALPIPPDVEAYDPKETTSIERENNTISGKKVVEYVLIPRFKGEYRIKPVTFSFFDDAGKRYVQLKSNEIRLQILEGDASGSDLVSGSSLSKQEVALLGEDIRYIKESAEFYQADRKLYENWLYLLSYLIPVIGFVIAWRYRNYRDRLKGNIEYARRHRAGKIASRQLTKARQNLRANEREEFYRSTTQALQGFVCDRLNLQVTDFSALNVQQVLQDAGLGSGEIEEYLSCLQQSDFQRYSGSSETDDEMNTFYQRVKRILTQLEKYI